MDIEYFLSNIFPIFGVCISTLQYGAPLKDVMECRRVKNLGPLNPIPLAVSFINCITWVIYGCVIHDKFLILSVASGTLISCFSVMTSLNLLGLHNRKVASQHVEKIILVSFSIWLILGFYCSIIDATITLRIWAIFAASTSMLYFLAPLSALVLVVRTKDASSLHLPSLKLNMLGTMSWLTYGLAVGNKTLRVTASTGLTLTIIQLILRASYGTNNLNSKKNDDIDTNIIIDNNNTTNNNIELVYIPINSSTNETIELLSNYDTQTNELLSNYDADKSIENESIIDTNIDINITNTNNNNNVELISKFESPHNNSIQNEQDSLLFKNNEVEQKLSLDTNNNLTRIHSTSSSDSNLMNKSVESNSNLINGYRINTGSPIRDFRDRSNSSILANKDIYNSNYSFGIPINIVTNVVRERSGTLINRERLDSLSNVESQEYIVNRENRVTSITSSNNDGSITNRERNNTINNRERGESSAELLMSAVSAFLAPFEPILSVQSMITTVNAEIDYLENDQTNSSTTDLINNLLTPFETTI